MNDKRNMEELTGSTFNKSCLAQIQHLEDKHRHVLELSEFKVPQNADLNEVETKILQAAGYLRKCVETLSELHKYGS